MIYNNCCHNLATSFKLLNPGSTLQRLARQLCRVHRPSQPPRSHHGPRFAGRRPSYPRLHDRQETRFSNFGIIEQRTLAVVGEVYLYSWSPLLQVWIQLLHYTQKTTLFLPWSRPVLLNCRPAVQ